MTGLAALTGLAVTSPVSYLAAVAIPALERAHPGAAQRDGRDRAGRRDRRQPRIPRIAVLVAAGRLRRVPRRQPGLPAGPPVRPVRPGGRVFAGRRGAGGWTGRARSLQRYGAAHHRRLPVRARAAAPARSPWPAGWSGTRAAGSWPRRPAPGCCGPVTRSCWAGSARRSRTSPGPACRPRWPGSAGGYGRCEQCACLIPVPRLRHDPEARYCGRCGRPPAARRPRPGPGRSLPGWREGTASPALQAAG